jgi:hypothetical protein
MLRCVSRSIFRLEEGKFSVIPVLSAFLFLN